MHAEVKEKLSIDMHPLRPETLLMPQTATQSLPLTYVGLYVESSGGVS